MKRKLKLKSHQLKRAEAGKEMKKKRKKLEMLKMKGEEMK